MYKTEKDMCFSEEVMKIFRLVHALTSKLKWMPYFEVVCKTEEVM